MTICVFNCVFMSMSMCVCALVGRVVVLHVLEDRVARSQYQLDDGRVLGDTATHLLQGVSERGQQIAVLLRQSEELVL